MSTYECPTVEGRGGRIVSVLRVAVLFDQRLVCGQCGAPLTWYHTMNDGMRSV